jgi:hypothetical protein
MGPTDKEAERQLLAELESPEYRAALTAGDPYAERRIHLAERVDAIDKGREQDEEDLLLDNMSRDTFLRLARKAEALKAKLLDELHGLPEPVNDIDPELILKAWREGDTMGKRKLLGLVVDYVEIKPATKFGGVFDTNRIKVHMRLASWADPSLQEPGLTTAA